MAIEVLGWNYARHDYILWAMRFAAVLAGLTLDAIPVNVKRESKGTKNGSEHDDLLLINCAVQCFRNVGPHRAPYGGI